MELKRDLPETLYVHNLKLKGVRLDEDKLSKKLENTEGVLWGKCRTENIILALLILQIESKSVMDVGISLFIFKIFLHFLRDIFILLMILLLQLRYITLQ